MVVAAGVGRHVCHAVDLGFNPEVRSGCGVVMVQLDLGEMLIAQVFVVEQIFFFFKSCKEFC